MSDTLLQPQPTQSVPASRRSFTELPADLLQDSARRLRVMGLLGAFVFFTLNFVAPVLLESETLAGLFGEPSEWLPPVLSIAVALIVALATKSPRFAPKTILNLGLLFQVVFSFGIAAAEYNEIYAPIQLRPGVYGGLGLSWVAVWMLLFFIAVPAPPRKALVAALASGLSVPITASLTIRYGPPTVEPITPAQIFVGLTFPYLMVALMAYVGARLVYKLGTDVTRAREMGSYRLTELLGRGGMGEVWRAKHRLLRRPAAIKVIHGDMLGVADEGGRDIVLKRFEQEAQATASLRSPHTIELYDFGIARDGSFYYVMELLEGFDLGTFVDRFGPVPPERAIPLLQQVCHSLAEAHEQGLIHRDIKPANIFVCPYGRDPDFVKVLDFGLVKVPTDSGSEDVNLTTGGFAGGTPSYIAPEQAVGERVDGRTDIYSLGCVAYWLLTGSLVFESDSVARLIADHVHATPAPLSDRVERKLPADLERVVLKCLEKKPGDRPRSAEELSEMLGACETDAVWTLAQAREWWDRNGSRAHSPGWHVQFGESGAVQSPSTVSDPDSGSLAR
jgi:serine/threonine-protein kinase